MNEKSSYIVGSTITLKVIVTPGDSITPEDATSVTLDTLVQGSTRPTISSPNFVHDGVGIYSYSLDTTGMAPGRWTWRTRAVVDSETAYAEDTFVLRAKS